jgi:hypothetical protein
VATSVVVQKPSRELLEQAAANLWIYGMLRRAQGRDIAFEQWCDILEVNAAERAGLAHTRIDLLQRMNAGTLVYDDIDWSNADEDRRASSTGTEFVDTLEGWFA